MGDKKVASCQTTLKAVRPGEACCAVPAAPASPHDEFCRRVLSTERLYEVGLDWMCIVEPVLQPRPKHAMRLLLLGDLPCIIRACSLAYQVLYTYKTAFMRSINHTCLIEVAQRVRGLSSPPN